MSIKNTLVFIKPDGVERKLVGEIISRFEKKNLKIGYLKKIRVTKEMAENLYEEHTGKEFYLRLVASLWENEIVVMIIIGEDVVGVVRRMVGKTTRANPGTIRGDYAETYPILNNIIHASDSFESAVREIKLFFPEVYLL